MRQAIALAQEGAAAPGGSPIGCVIVLDGRVVAAAHNEVGLQCDPTAHAEVVAIRAATKLLGQPDLRGATLYSTLQPCGMCSMASIWAKVGRIVLWRGTPPGAPDVFRGSALRHDGFRAGFISR